MPTYQYACKECGHQFEAVQSFTDDSLTDCPQCSGRLRKVYGSIGVVFKGSGFYRTDSRSGGKSAANGDASGSSTSTSGSSDSGSSPSTSSTSSSSGSGSASSGSSGSSATTKAS